MPEQLLETIEIQTHARCDWSLIWLHGLGADGSDFVPVVPELALDPAIRVRFVFPNAPAIPVTCNGGYIMPAWYDIISLDADSREVDVDGLVRTRQRIRQLIERENARGVDSRRIFLAGFSQGGAVAYLAGLTHAAPLAGLIALSTYLPVTQEASDEAAEANRRIPIFAAHGIYDDVVSLELGLRARDFLTQNGYRPEWHEYPMQHSVCLEEVRDLGAWLGARIAAA